MKLFEILTEQIIDTISNSDLKDSPEEIRKAIVTTLIATHAAMILGAQGNANLEIALKASSDSIERLTLSAQSFLAARSEGESYDRN